MKEKSFQKQKENFIEEETKLLFGYDKESLLKEMEEARKEWEELKTQNPDAAAQITQEMHQSFDQLMSHMKEEGIQPLSEDELQKEEKIRRELLYGDLTDVEDEETAEPTGGLKAGVDVKVLSGGKKSKRKVLLLAAAVCVLGAAMGIVTVADRRLQYELHLREEEKNILVKRNHQNIEHIGELEKAYERIALELNIKPVGIYYNTMEMEYISSAIVKRMAMLKFRHGDEVIHLNEIAHTDKTGSVEHRSSDCQVIDTIYNIWLNKEIEICENVLENGNREYISFVSTDTAMYTVSGILEKEDFIKIVSSLYYYE